MSKLYAVGLGPGDSCFMTGDALRAIEESDTVVGYTLYVELVADLTVGKTVLSTPMRREVERCRLALEQAATGHTVALVCSGDSGVYGMAGVLLQLAQEYPAVQVEILPGITAACSGAAVLGAPLIHDFAVISLSDLLTPWEKIARRLQLAAQADFVICLYNPASKKRHDYLQRACDEVLRHQSPATVCGVVRNIGRAGQQSQVCTLAQLRDMPADMFTTVFIGNSQTMQIGNRMVTPRGYCTDGAR
ncbi:Cobalt-precorrin-3B C(17)-methyltransferase [Anaerotruncus sp. 2789STDY5834896]|uniref:Cobalt-precorrin-3B C(17)-methyltransferase n=1 Tax=uncultured Anaerotruncus sp. TaxID=905011 RepID=A0A1C6GUD6_9FIRM|nr:Cobalt-precorrin-3B C(17)-methyltransferase [uncultured Anaerotruncus sp.]